jgi:hypothetical protein
MAYLCHAERSEASVFFKDDDSLPWYRFFTSLRSVQNDNGNYCHAERSEASVFFKDDDIVL